MDFIDYQPGNGTRYALFVGHIDTDNRYGFVIMWAKRQDVGGPAFFVPYGSYLTWDYLDEKMGVGNMADLAALLAFIRDHAFARGQQVEVRMPDGFDRRGLYAHQPLEVPRG